ncbi:MAG: alanine--tRNA ligase [Chloroflexota bacterium]
MTSDELRELFLRFFVERDHQMVPSSSLVPHGDPTLLLTTAGMVQMKPYFLGQATPPKPRLASCQKCFRTTDIDSVGDAKHLTFFEMLGNFSVGDYFKKEAIAWAWEFVTGWVKLPRERLWTTVYLDDDEAAGLWTEAGVPPERVIRLGKKDNFWGPAGDSGPCGPCSEIHYDLGKDVGCRRADCNPGCDCERFVEVWNLVFMQFNQDRQGKRTPLPRPNIDTGMGLERLAAVVHGKLSVYDTDTFRPLLQRVAEISGKQYGRGEASDRAMRVVAEHARGIAFLIADGVIPGNEGRGYVLRRLLRRAALFGRKLGLEKPFLAEMAGAVIQAMGHVYPELTRGRDFILQVIRLEEERFQDTLSTGLENLDGVIARKGEGLRVISGEEAFVLYDTYGFPVELTREIARDRGFTVDEAGFEQQMEQQRQRARAAARFGNAEAHAAFDYSRLTLPATVFTGYESTSGEGRIVSLVVDGSPADVAEAGQGVEVVLDTTPFYAEMGGQVGDEGVLKGATGSMQVEDTVWVRPELIAHRGHVVGGRLVAGDTVTAEVDAERRADIMRNHTATHLLQAALRQVLGEHVQQRGSLVSPERLRFDFSHLRALEADEVERIQRLVNESIRRNLPVVGRVVQYQQAINEGAIALFDEKYGDTVRMVQVGEPPARLSAELCGGTHVSATGNIGLLLITSEGSIGAGLRRIEAVTGRGAEGLAGSYMSSLQGLAEQLRSTPEEVPQKLAALQAELDAERKHSAQLERELSRRVAESLVGQATPVNGVTVLAARVSASTMAGLREMGDVLREKLGSAVIALGTVVDGRPQFLVMVTPDLVGRGLHAGKIALKVAQVTGGGGGGKPEMAQAGGKDRNKMAEALALVPGLVEKAVQK